MAEPVRHRQTKGAATDMFGLPPPRHISTLPSPGVAVDRGTRPHWSREPPSKPSIKRGIFTISAVAGQCEAALRVAVEPVRRAAWPYVAQGPYPRRERVAVVFDDVVEFA